MSVNNCQSQVNTALHQIEEATVAVVAALMCFFNKNGHSRPLLSLFSSLQYILFNTADGNLIDNDWIRTAEHWCGKQPLYQLRQNIFIAAVMC